MKILKENQLPQVHGSALKGSATSTSLVMTTLRFRGWGSLVLTVIPVLSFKGRKSTRG